MVNSEFLFTSLIVVLVPGTGVIYTVSMGLAQRWRASIAAAFGCTLGILPHLLASILGLSAILHMSAITFQVIKFAGALYLLYLAWGMWRDKGMLKLEQSGQKGNAFQIALKGILINVLNPKLTLFFFAFLPLFITPDASSPTGQMLGLGAIFMLLTLLIFILYGILASTASIYLLNSPKVIRRVQKSFALIFAGLAVRLALSEQ
ncbi:LysE family translocator [Candidatus Leptofilum sp.]|uniref:LysE family translocator n=1 Tax=Candidatus Leptofilum sp. TaxID=3241576 RepID=UPI003B5B46B0